MIRMCVESNPGAAGLSLLEFSTSFVSELLSQDRQRLPVVNQGRVGTDQSGLNPGSAGELNFVPYELVAIGA